MSSETPPAEAGKEAAPAKGGGGGGMLPAIIAVVVAPALTFAVAKFVLIPQLRSELAAGGAEPAAEAHAAPAPAEGGHGAKESGGHGKGGEAGAASNTYIFSDVVVNLAGTMGTRYLKTTFMVTGSDANLNATFEGNKAALVDITLNVLSSLSLTDLEEAGSKNLIREKLVQSYNQVLGRKVAEQIYFSDFVVQ